MQAAPGGRARSRRRSRAGRKGFKAELDALRERIHGLGFSYDEIVAEIGRRYRVRPREVTAGVGMGVLAHPEPPAVCDTPASLRYGMPRSMPPSDSHADQPLPGAV
jgi:hypothetical protein